MDLTDLVALPIATLLLLAFAWVIKEVAAFAQADFAKRRERRAREQTFLVHAAYLRASFFRATYLISRELA